jgi:anaerobic glycerol-3-phosphate dehydrogenase
MRKSLLVIGGLTGLFAAVVAARRGAAVRLIAEGRGGLTLSHGCIDIWRDGDLRFSLGRLDRSHPLRIAGWAALEAALVAFLAIMHDVHLPYAGSLDRRWSCRPLSATHVAAAVGMTSVAG